jgi:U3 small nucleolar ribonucleoprotein protein IMP4
MGMSEVLSLVEGDPGPLLIVGEYHGNPGSLIFYTPDGRELLSVRTSVTTVKKLQKKISPKILPVATGHGDLAPILAKILAIQLVDEPSSPLVLEISDDQLDFFYDGQELFRLNIKTIR